MKTFYKTMIILSILGLTVVFVPVKSALFGVILSLVGMGTLLFWDNDS